MNTDNNAQTASLQKQADKPQARTDVKSELLGDRFAQAVKAVLPKHITAERFLRIAVLAATRDARITEDRSSLFNCLLQLSQWGLEPDGRRAHLIPFWNSRRKLHECQLIIDYKGLVELALRSGTISSIHADIVCENDVFEYNLGQVIQHRIDFSKPRGGMYAAYCIIRFRDGCDPKCEVMTRSEIDSIRSRSRAKDSGPWVTDYNEMAKKTVFRRCSKWLNLSAELRDAFDADDDQLEERRIEVARPIFQTPPSLLQAIATAPEQPQEPETTEESEVVLPDDYKTLLQMVTSQMQTDGIGENDLLKFLVDRKIARPTQKVSDLAGNKLKDILRNWGVIVKDVKSQETDNATVSQ